MARYRHDHKIFKRASSSGVQPFKLLARIGGNVFEAEGKQEVVIQQYDKFLEVVKQGHFVPRLAPGTPKIPIQNQMVDFSCDPFEPYSPSLLPTLEQLLQNDTESTVLTLKVPFPGNHQEANAILLLLLGYRELRAVPEVSVIVLNQALTRSFGPVRRIDRALKTYTKDRFVVKTGRGKGGKYRLTSLGYQKALEKAIELATLHA